MKFKARLLLLCAVVLLGVQSAEAVDISGPIANTLVIFDNSKLVGNLTCTVVSAPCIQFGSSGIKLELNGFTMTGLAHPIFGCFTGGPVPGEDGIDTGGQSDVVVEGPGLVRRFRDHGIDVSGGVNNLVKKVTSSTNCHNGIQLSASNSKVEENVAVRNSSIATAPCGGIEIAGNSNIVKRNETSGNGLEFGTFFGPVDFGIGVSSGTGNLIEENSAAGNTPNGITVFPGAVGNVLRKNVALGNPPIAVPNLQGFTEGVDIRNLSAAGANTFEDNHCETSISAPCPNLTPFVGHQNN